MRYRYYRIIEILCQLCICVCVCIYECVCVWVAACVRVAYGKPVRHGCTSSTFRACRSFGYPRQASCLPLPLCEKKEKERKIKKCADVMLIILIYY